MLNTNRQIGLMLPAAAQNLVKVIQKMSKYYLE